jgi:hypothetical protein
MTVSSALNRSLEAGTHYLIVMQEGAVSGVCCRCDLIAARAIDRVDVVVQAGAGL